MLSLHTNPLQQPGQGDAGGLNVYVLHLARQLCRLGCDVDILTADPSTAGSGTIATAEGPRVHQLDLPGGVILSKADLGGRIEELAILVAAHPVWDRADIVHAHYWISAAAALRARRGREIPVIATMHTLGAVKNEAVGYRLEPQHRLDEERWIAREVDLLIANARRDREDHLRLLGAAPERVRIIRPGVDAAVFHPRSQEQSRASLGLGDTDLMCLYVGRMQHVKGPDIAIEAFASLNGLNPGLAARTRLVVLGESSGERTALNEAKELAARHGVVSRMRFVPPVPAERLALWYSSADVLLVPSRSESFGLVALEAAASGLPVLASAVGGLSEAVAATGGRLLDTAEPRRWARELELLLLDPAERAAIGARAAGRAAALSWDVAAEQTAEAYRRVKDAVHVVSVDARSWAS